MTPTRTLSHTGSSFQKPQKQPETRSLYVISLFNCIWGPFLFGGDRKGRKDPANPDSAAFVYCAAAFSSGRGLVQALFVCGGQSQNNYLGVADH